MNKKAIAILGGVFLLIVGVLGYLIYARSSTKNQAQVAQEQSTPAPEPAPEEPEPTPEPTEPTPVSATKLTDDRVVSPTFSFDQTGLVYFDAQGNLLGTKITQEGTSLLLQDKQNAGIPALPNVVKVIWPSTGQSFIAIQLSGDKKTITVADEQTGTLKPLPKQVYSIDWATPANKVFYIWVDEKGKATLNIANPDLNAYVKLADIWDADTMIDVSPDGSQIAFYRNQSTDITKNVIAMVSADGKVFKGIAKEGYNRGINWSPDSKKFVFGKQMPGSQRYELWLADIITGATTSLGVKTSPEKTVWSSDSQSIYAAEPKGNSGFVSAGDQLYKIDVSTGSNETLEIGATVDMKDLFIIDNYKSLFFKDGLTGALFYLPL